jgi:hypothetical protein
MAKDYGANNVAEQLWEVFFKKMIKGKVTDLGRVKKLREAFFHGLFCGSDMLIKATKLPDQQCEAFVQGFREQIAAGLRGDGQHSIDLRLSIEDKPKIIPATTIPKNN